jgi:hypothetical protein
MQLLLFFYFFVLNFVLLFSLILFDLIVYFKKNLSQFQVLAFFICQAKLEKLCFVKNDQNYNLHHLAWFQNVEGPNFILVQNLEFYFVFGSSF